MNSYNCIADDVQLSNGVKLARFINLHGCVIGDASRIGAYVEIQKDARVGKNCKISSHSFIGEGTQIEDDVFMGHGVMCVNYSHPHSLGSDGSRAPEEWKPARICKGASIGAGSTIHPNVVVGEGAIVGAGSTVDRDVPARALVAGNPAQVLKIVETPAEKREKPIPFVDLVMPHLQMEQELVNAFRMCLRTASFIGGAPVQDFETGFAKLCRCTQAVAVSSGTDALRFALMAVGVGPNCVVVTVPNTFIATTEAISQTGALAEFVDVEERTYNLSVKALETYLTAQCTCDTAGNLVSIRSGLPVKAIVPVHLYGQIAEMDAILDLAERFGLVVVEDACQAHGAEYFSARRGQWMRAGSLGAAAAFSFYPGKNLGALGEGGAVTTSDPAVASHVRLLRDHGQAKKYVHEVEGYNGRLDAIQCAFLKAKLPHLEEWNRQRREHAQEYARLLFDEPGVVLPYEPEWSHSAWHLYVVRVREREALRKSLEEAGVATGLHYPIPLHLQKPYAARGYAKDSFPVAERAASEILSLPMYPQLTPEEQARIAAGIRAFQPARTNPARELAPA